jgi:predicted NUDIX family NTP pyrophosphohydrolase
MRSASKASAGLLLFRETSRNVEVLLVHPGGPFWAKKEAGAWSVPKGEFIPLQPRRQAGGKLVYAWAVRSDFDPARLTSNTFSMEWPPRSGRQQAFPEIDRAAWFALDMARMKILKGQVGFLDELEKKLEKLAPPR